MVVAPGTGLTIPSVSGPCEHIILVPAQRFPRFSLGPLIFRLSAIGTFVPRNAIPGRRRRCGTSAVGPNDSIHTLAISIDAGVPCMSRPGIGYMSRLVPCLCLTGGEGNRISVLQIISTATESNGCDQAYK
jgi:hypothetical protein